jgi:hypothetical protein
VTDTRDRTATLAAAAALIPVPLLDTWVENRARRAVTKQVLAARGIDLPKADIATLSDLPFGGVKGAIKAVLTWPVKKLLGKLFLVFDAKRAWSTRKDVLRRAQLLDEALEYGLLPGDAAAVRGRFDAP